MESINKFESVRTPPNISVMLYSLSTNTFTYSRDALHRDISPRNLSRRELLTKLDQFRKRIDWQEKSKTWDEASSKKSQKKAQTRQMATQRLRPPVVKSSVASVTGTMEQGNKVQHYAKLPPTFSAVKAPYGRFQGSLTSACKSYVELVIARSLSKLEVEDSRRIRRAQPWLKDGESLVDRRRKMDYKALCELYGLKRLSYRFLLDFNAPSCFNWVPRMSSKACVKAPRKEVRPPDTLQALASSFQELDGYSSPIPNKSKKKDVEDGPTEIRLPSELVRLGKLQERDPVQFMRDRLQAAVDDEIIIEYVENSTINY